MGQPSGTQVADDADEVALLRVIHEHQREGVALPAGSSAGVADHFQADHAVDLFLLFSGPFRVDSAPHMAGGKNGRFFQSERDQFHPQVQVLLAEQRRQVTGRCQLDCNGAGIVVCPHGARNRVVVRTQQQAPGGIRSEVDPGNEIGDVQILELIGFRFHGQAQRAVAGFDVGGGPARSPGCRRCARRW